MRPFENNPIALKGIENSFCGRQRMAQHELIWSPAQGRINSLIGRWITVHDDFATGNAPGLATKKITLDERPGPRAASPAIFSTRALLQITLPYSSASAPHS